jgi:hypothetical protein
LVAKFKSFSRRAASHGVGGKKGKAKGETESSMDSSSSHKSGKSSASGKKSGGKGSKQSDDDSSYSPKVKADKTSSKGGDDSVDKDAKGKGGKGEADSVDKDDKGKGDKGKDGDDGADAPVAMPSATVPVAMPSATAPVALPSATAPVALPYTPTSSPAAPSPVMPAPTLPAPTAAPTFTPIDMDMYKIRSCGELPEEFVLVEVSYLYNLRTAENVDRNAAIYFIEAETLKYVSADLFDCELSRRRLNTLVGVSALPEDVASGSCGEGCVEVVGGMSIYVEDQGSSDFTQLQCEALEIIRNTMLELESVEGGIEEIAFVDDSDYDCDSILAGLSSVTEAEPEKLAANKNGKSLIPIIIGSVLGAALIAGFALFVAKRRRNDESTQISVVGDKGDLVSVGTPESAAGDTQFTPQMSMCTPNKGSPLSTLPDTPEHELLDADGSPIAQFDPAMIDATSRAGNNVNADNVDNATAAKIGAGTALLSRFMRGEKKEDQSAPNMPEDHLYDNGDHEAQDADVNGGARPSVPPMVMRTQNSDFMHVDAEVQHSAEYSTLILSGIPEVGDDTTVDTAAISNTSLNKE